MKKLFCFFIVMSLVIVIGCAIFGGTSIKPSAKPVAKLEAELEAEKKDIDESKKEVSGIEGDVSMFEQRISTMETNLATIQSQITTIITQTTQYNESLKSIIWTVAGIWILIKVLAFVQMIIAAKVLPGKTIKNFFTMPWEKKK